MEDLLTRVADWLEIYGYPLLFLLVILENAGIPLPGETGVLVAGFLASKAGGYRFHLSLVILLVFVAAVCGDNLGFWMGRRWARPYLQRGRRFLLLTPELLLKADSYFDRYGSWTIFFARFITGLRVIGALAAGTCGMPWRRFLIANAAGAIAWAATFSCVGYLFGENLHLIEKMLRRGGFITLLIVALIVLGIYSWRRWSRSGIQEPPRGIGASNQDNVNKIDEEPPK